MEIFNSSETMVANDRISTLKYTMRVWLRLSHNCEELMLSYDQSGDP